MRINVRNTPSVGYPPTAVGYPPTAVGYPPTAVGYPPTAVGYPPTAVGCPLTTVIFHVHMCPELWRGGTHAAAQDGGVGSVKHSSVRPLIRGYPPTC